MQAEDSEETLHVLDKILAARLLLKILNTVEEVEGSHIVRVGLSHLDQINLELLIKFLPSREVFVLRVSKELKAFANSE